MKKFWCFMFGHTPFHGYTNSGLPIYAVGGSSDKYLRNSPFRDINIDDLPLPNEMIRNYSQEIVYCASCGTKLVHHT